MAEHGVGSSAEPEGAAGGLSSPSVLRDISRAVYERRRAAVLEHERRTKQDERGWIGRLFGGSGEKQGNIAGFALLLFIVLFAFALFFYTDQGSGLSKKDVLAVIGGFITLTLGYIFGKSS